MLCFAYGSNMSRARLQHRVPAARFVTVATLAGYRLRFHMAASDHSAKCDAVQTDNKDDCVIGVVYEIPLAGKPVLDRFEGVGVGYTDKMVDVVAGQDRLTAVVYCAIAIDRSLKPYYWYKEHVLRGARENHLPDDYVARIEAIPAINDRNVARREQELAIYA